MSDAVEGMINSLKSRLENTVAINKTCRSFFDTVNYDDMPAIRLIQGEEILSEFTLGMYECNLSVGVQILCGKGSDEIETSLNRLHRNVLQEIFSERFAEFDIIERRVGAPEAISEEGGQMSGSMVCDFELRYQKAINEY